ncbi:MAG TPA: carboxy terminal-processing peptidase [Kofleriaceae bacterium]
MSRFRIGFALLTALIACSPKAPAPGESPQGPATTTTAAAPMAAPAAAPKAAPPDPREATLSAAVLQMLEQEHLLKPKIDDALSRTAFASYLDRVDGAKMFLLASDRDALGKYADKIDDEMRSGSLDLAHDGEKRFAMRVAQVKGWVAQIMAQPMTFTTEEYFETDPKKVAPAATEDELKDRWRRRLKLELLERVTAMEASLDKHAGSGAGSGSADPAILKIPTTPEGREAKAREELARAYAARFARLLEPPPLEAASELLNAVTSSIDPHTDYLPPADRANFDIAMTGSLEGIGASLGEHDHYIEVKDVIPGGAAWREGELNIGDLILSVSQDGKDPVDTADMHIDDVVKMIRGPKGTIVHLRVQKQSGIESTISITRDKVVVEATYARGAVLSKKGGELVGYIHLPSFYGGSDPGQRTASGDIKELIGQLKAKKVSAIILDLRGNGGGLLGDAVELTGELVDEGPVVQVKNSQDQKKVLGDDEPGEDFTGPVIVMIDRFSASASEIVAAALQDYHRAIIVGTATHGKGTVQTLADLDRVTGGKYDLGVLKLTIEQFFRINGVSTQREGVKPDIELPDSYGYLDTRESSLDHALPASKIDPVKHDDWPATYDLGSLAARSSARVAKDPILAKISSTVEVLSARRKDTRMPLDRAGWDARRKEMDKALDAVSPDFADAPARLDVAAVEDLHAPKIAPVAGRTIDDRVTKWRDGLARDPWIAECYSILGDLAAKGVAKK